MININSCRRIGLSTMICSNFKSYWSELDTSIQRRLRSFHQSNHTMWEWREHHKFSMSIARTTLQTWCHHNMISSMMLPKFHYPSVKKKRPSSVLMKCTIRFHFRLYQKLWLVFHTKHWVIDESQMRETISISIIKIEQLRKKSKILRTNCTLFHIFGSRKLSRWRETI